MTEIHKNLFIGNQNDYEFKVKNRVGWNGMWCTPAKNRTTGRSLGIREKGRRKITPNI